MVTPPAVVSSTRGIALVCRHSQGELRPLLERAASINIEVEELNRLLHQKQCRKYYSYLAEELLEEGLARDYLDIDGAQTLL